MKKLAIKGHNTRGNEVIELLEMLGGRNKDRYYGNIPSFYYFINENYNIDIYYECESDFFIFTLEDFLEKFPYKVGDKVQAWINGYCGIFNIQAMKWDSVANEIKYKIHEYYHSVDNIQPYFYKEETMKEKLEQIILEIPTGYEFFGINDDNKVVLTKKQLKYPQTYKECFNICFGNKHHIVQVVGLDGLGNNKELFEIFIKLKICRDAYWKIAGEEMGLDKPWEPQFQNYNIQHYCIFVNIKGNIHKCCFYASKCLLAFPTEEIRDDFYENFKDLIEECKELL